MTAADRPPESPPAAPDPAVPHAGWAARAVVWLLGASGVAAVLCCGGGFYWMNAVEQTEDPDLVRAATDNLLSIDLPPAWEPERAMHVPPPPGLGWVRPAETDVVGYATEAGGQLLITRLSGRAGDDTPTARTAAAQMTGG